MIKVTCPIRQPDAHGAGYFGAPRGSRKHNGIDYACYPGSEVYPTVAGTVTKLGYPYAAHTEYRYVEVTDTHHREHRYFYIYPSVRVGEYVTVEDVIGKTQDLTKIYPGITNHVHYEIKHGGQYLNPEEIV